MRAYNVLFLCETNTALSPLAEVTLNHILPQIGVCAFSAGRAPGDAILPEVADFLGIKGHAPHHFEPKSWDLFTFASSPRPALIVDLAAVTWAQRPDPLDRTPRLSWPMADPSLLPEGPTRRAAVERAFDLLQTRISHQLLARIRRDAASPTSLVNGHGTGLKETGRPHNCQISAR